MLAVRFSKEQQQRTMVVFEFHARVGLSVILTITWKVRLLYIWKETTTLDPIQHKIFFAHCSFHCSFLFGVDYTTVSRTSY